MLVAYVSAKLNDVPSQLRYVSFSAPVFSSSTTGVALAMVNKELLVPLPRIKEVLLALPVRASVVSPPR